MKSELFILVNSISTFLVAICFAYTVYRNTKELDGLYTHVIRFTNYANDLLDRIKLLSDRIVELEKKES